MEYVCIGLVSTYYTICCGLMCHSLCGEYHDGHKQKKRKYHLKQEKKYNITMMPLREYEYRNQDKYKNIKLDIIPEE
jgi:hypothetical protein